MEKETWFFGKADKDKDLALESLCIGILGLGAVGGIIYLWYQLSIPPEDQIGGILKELGPLILYPNVIVAGGCLFLGWWLLRFKNLALFDKIGFVIISLTIIVAINVIHNYYYKYGPLLLLFISVGLSFYGVMVLVKDAILFKTMGVEKKDTEDIMNEQEEKDNEALGISSPFRQQSKELQPRKEGIRDLINEARTMRTGPISGAVDRTRKKREADNLGAVLPILEAEAKSYKADTERKVAVIENRRKDFEWENLETEREIERLKKQEELRKFKELTDEKINTEIKKEKVEQAKYEAETAKFKREAEPPPQPIQIQQPKPKTRMEKMGELESKRRRIKEAIARNRERAIVDLKKKATEEDRELEESETDIEIAYWAKKEMEELEKIDRQFR